MTRAKDISKILTDADLSGNLDVTGTVTAGGNVGINESNPSSSLHIYGSTPKITLEHSNENGTAQIYTQSQSGIILDADPDNTDNGTPIQFKIDGSEVGRFDDGNNLLVGKTVADNTTVGVRIQTDGFASFARDGNFPLLLNRKSSDGTILDLRKDGTTVGSIGVLSSRIYIGNIDTALFFNDSSNAVTPYNVTLATQSNGVIDLGTSGTRFKDLHLSGGVFSNTLSVGTTSTNGALTITGSIVARETDGQFEIISRDISGSSGTDYGDIILKGQRSTDGDTTTIATFKGANGNVGIGTSSPQGKLSVSNGTIFVGSEANTTQTNNLLNGYGYRIGSTIYGSVSVRSSYNNGNNQASLEFYTAGSDGSNERMRIDSSGNLLVGTTSASIETSGGVGFVSAGAYNVFRLLTSSNNTATIAMVQFGNPNGNVGSISIGGSATSYNTSSDYRLKENVVTDWDATTRLKQLKPSRFNFIADANTTVDGFLAHEVSSIVPEAIIGTKDAVDDDGNPVYQGIDQSKLVPLLVKTIQELEARITALETA